MRFETWLSKQKHRNDPIGDLAKDWIFTSKPTPFTLEVFYSWCPCDDAVKAYRSALQEWLCDLGYRKNK